MKGAPGTSVNPSPRPHIRGLAGVRRPLKVLLALVGLYAATFTLQWAAILKRVVQLPVSGAVSLSPLPDPLTTRSVEVTGTATPLRMIEIGVNDRMRGVTVSGPDGHFRQSLDLTPGARRVWVRALDEKFEEIARAESAVRWKPGTFLPALDLCLRLEEQALVWVAGRATPGEQVRLATDLEGVQPQDVSVDDAGVLDVLIPVQRSSSGGVSVRIEGPSGAHPSLECQDARSAEEIPLGRSAIIDQRQDPVAWALRFERLDGAGREAELTQSLDALLPTAEFEITLPTAHPYFQAVIRGDLSGEEFVRRTFGELTNAVTGDLLVAVRMAFSKPGLPPLPDLKPKTQIQLQGGSGTVRTWLRLLSGFPGFPQRQVQFRSARDAGIGSEPLLSARDKVTVRTSESLGWSFEVIPSKIEGGEVTWSGPLQVRHISASGPDPPLSAMVRSARGTASQPANMKEFLGRFEPVAERNLFSVFWRTLLAIVPAACLWLVVRKKPFASHPGTPAVIGLAAVLAVWRTWPLLSELAKRGSFLALGLVESTLSAAATFRAVSEVEGLSDLARRVADLGNSCFWVVFVATIGMAPLYFSALTRAISAQSPAVGAANEGRLQGRVRFGVSIVYAVYAAAVLAFLAIMTPERWIVWSEAAGSLAATELTKSFLGRVLPGLDPAAIVPSLVWAAVLLCFGVRGLLLAVAHVAVTLLFVATWDSTLRSYAVSGLHPVSALALLGLAAYPLVLRLLRSALPSPWPRAARPAAAAGFVLVSLFLPRFPPIWMLVAAAGLMGLGFLWVAAASLGSFEPASRTKRWLEARPLSAAAVFTAVGVGIGWPVIEPGKEPQLGAVAGLMGHWSNLLPYVLAIPFALLLWEQGGKSRSRVFPAEVLSAGALFYAVFLISPATTWLFVPVPLLVALLVGRNWIFKDEYQLRALDSAQQQSGSDTKKLVRQVIEGQSWSARVQSAVKALNSKFEKAQMEPSVYAKRLKAYGQYAASQPGVSTTRAERVFALGESDAKARLVAFLRIGLLLSSVPIMISLYQYLPVSRVSYPFPVADFVVFFLLAILKWALYAVFFGLFFANLAGNTGLSKGIGLFVALGVPFGVYRLLGAASIGELRPFLLWLAQLFVFCGMIGLVASDLRLLREAGFHLRDLKAIHRVPTLSAFASTALAAIIPAILSVIAGKAGDVVKFFIQTLLPGMPNAP